MVSRLLAKPEGILVQTMRAKCVRQILLKEIAKDLFSFFSKLSPFIIYTRYDFEGYLGFPSTRDGVIFGLV